VIPILTCAKAVGAITIAAVVISAVWIALIVSSVSRLPDPIDQVGH
jgi:hypothetical protein